MRPDYAPSYYVRSLAYTEIGRYGEAIDDIKVALKLKPNDTYYRKHMASLQHIDPGYKPSMESIVQVDGGGTQLIIAPSQTSNKPDTNLGMPRTKVIPNLNMHEGINHWQCCLQRKAAK